VTLPNVPQAVSMYIVFVMAFIALCAVAEDWTRRP
jgi:hypothetical protein